MRGFLLGFVIALASPFLFTGCLPSPGGEAPIYYADTPDAKPAPWEKKGEYMRQWTLHAYHQLRLTQPSPADIVPRDIGDFCPEYTSMDRLARINFWVQVLAGMARHESSFKPETQHAEDFKDQYGRQVISRGLLQMSIGSVESPCGLRVAEQLHDPFTNLTCGVKLLMRYVRRDNVIADKDKDHYLGGARYWAVLRPGHHDFLESIRGSTKDFCAQYR